MEFEHDDFGIGAEAEWRAPSSGAAGGEDLEVADAAESVNELAIDAAREPVPRDELAEVGVAGELERDAGGFRGGGMVGRVGEQDAGAIAVHAERVQGGGEVSGAGGAAVGDAENLEAVGVNLFVVEDADSGVSDGVKILAVVAELLVVSGDEVNAVGSGEIAERAAARRASMAVPS